MSTLLPLHRWWAVPTLLFSTLLLTTLNSSAHAEDKIKLEGLYACEGKNPDGGPYEGRVEIAKKGDTYHLKWTIGEESHVGVGLVAEKTLSVCWVVDGGGAGGIVVYKIEMDGRLVGKWTPLGGDKVYEENLRRIPDA
jgi:hypothetical protein